MDIAVLGCGNIGSVVTRDLAENLPTARIMLADFDAERAQKVAAGIGRSNVSWIQTDASNHNKLVTTLKKFDLAVGTLPGHLGFQACKAAIAAGVDMVDVSYMPQDVMSLQRAALKAKMCLVPDCGMSPGLGNMLIGHAVSRLDSVDSVHILNGGLPEKPVPPLGYVITWSASDLIDMYSRKVTIVRQGKTTRVKALTGLEETTFPGIGELEAFYTDGLRTLLRTVRGVHEMWEKTLRYPGHVEKIRLLQALGFFDEKPVEVRGVSVSPKDVATRLFEKKLRKPEVRDIVAISIKVSGTKNDHNQTYSYRVFDRFDVRGKVTAMARTTAYSASVVAQMLAQKMVEDKGVVPPESIGMNDRLYRKFVKEMDNRRINIQESISSAKL